MLAFEQLGRKQNRGAVVGRRQSRGALDLNNGKGSTSLQSPVAPSCEPMSDSGLMQVQIHKSRVGRKARVSHGNTIGVSLNAGS
jgi:hypothetical protein